VIEDCQFRPIETKPWLGRYGRIPGEESVFHIKRVDGCMCITAIWKTGDYVATCKACNCQGVSSLTQAVIRAKERLGGYGGGSFVINEFGQVIVLDSDNSGRRVLVGEIDGPFFLENPLEEDAMIDLSNTDGLKCGDRWTQPYIGTPYNLSKRSKIYFYRKTDEGGKTEYPAAQDQQLIKSLRRIRRYGAVRFIANPYGVVLTKRPPEEDWSQHEEWQSVFVGHINHNYWFSKEV
jgi:hypothetical protein